MTLESEIVKGVMRKYAEKLAEWIEESGNDYGFDEWFTKQIEQIG